MPGLLAGQERLELLATDCGPPTGWPDPIGGNCTRLGERVFFNLALANAALRAGEPAEAFGVCVDTVHDLVGTGLVVGNPLFHLLTGLAAHGAGEPAGTVRDDLARAAWRRAGDVRGRRPGPPAQPAGRGAAPAALGRWEARAGTCWRCSPRGSAPRLRGASRNAAHARSLNAFVPLTWSLTLTLTWTATATATWPWSR